MATSSMTVVEFVRAFVAREGRGCPDGALQFVGGFSKKDIKAAKESGEIVTRKGSDGGNFVAGEVNIVSKAAPRETLKGDMAAFITAIANDSTNSQTLRDTAHALISRYNAELQNKKAAAAKRSAQ